MGAVRTVALAVLGLSLIVFIALFGRLPIFRRTPIGLCHRVIWVYIPRGFLSVDNRLTGGRIFSCLRRTENYLMNEKHPLVLIFFILLQSISQILFIPAAWPQLSVFHRILIPPVVIGTYALLYLAYATPSSVTTQNHHAALRHYPYDHTLYHPGVWCRTCQFPKPPRSKHCSICKTCISKMDHHCIWLNNCVGRNNYLYFLTLLVAVSIMLAYGFALGHGILDDHLQTRENPNPTQHWSKTDPPMTWAIYFQMYSIALAENLRVGAVTLLAGMSFPLSSCLFIYHVYLIWAGMTTNESDKWAGYRDDISYGTIWRARRRDLFEDYPLAHPTLEPRESEIDSRWKGDKSSTRDEKAGEGQNHGWWVIRLGNRREVVRRWKPKIVVEDGNSQGGNGPSEQQKPPEMEPGDQDERWHRVKSLAELVNIYDLGFWDNVRDVIWNRGD